MNFLFPLLLVVLMSFSSCKNEMGPEETLRKFINYRFQGESGKSKALRLTTGELKKILVDLEQNEKASRAFWKMEKQSKKRLKVIVKNCQETECFITYILSYLQKNESPEARYDIETKKIAKLLKIEDEWLLSDVSDVKTFIDSKIELVPESK